MLNYILSSHLFLEFENKAMKLKVVIKFTVRVTYYL